MRILQKSAWLLCAAMLSFGTQKAMAQAKTFTAGDLTYTENFDGMGTVAPSVYPTGWTANNNGGTALVLANPNDGGTGTGSIVNLGVAGVNAITDRALGTIASGSVVPHFGTSFTNSTGSSIASVSLSGFMEQWKAGGNAVIETVVFEYSTDATSLSTGTWTAATGMNLVEKLTTDNGNIKKDGNDALNRTSIDANITGLSWSNGQTMWIRWKDVNDTGADGIYAIDDFSMTVTLAAACTPTKLAITSVTPVSPVQNQLFNVTVQAQSAGSTACSLGADALVTLSGTGIGGTTTGTIVGGTSSITISGVTLSQAGNITVTAAGGSLTDATTSITVQEAANQLIFGTMPTSGLVGVSVTSFSVRAARTDATTDATYTGSITLSKASGPGVLGGTLTKNAASGVANFNDITFSTAGSYTLLATATSVAGTVTSSAITIVAAPTMAELVVPQYFGSKTGASANTARSPISMCVNFSNLLPNTAYDIRYALALAADAANVMGAGSQLVTGNTFGSGTYASLFTTNASGTSGPVWLYIQPTGNGSRFDAGQVHHLRVALAPTGQAVPTVPSIFGVKTLTALDIATTARTPETTDDGAFVKVTNLLYDYAGKQVLIYDNTAGTGNPLYSFQCVTASVANTSQSSLPTSINDVWTPAASARAGDFAAVVPITLNNPNGVRRIEVRNANNTIAYATTDADGIWHGVGNTISLARRDVAIISPSCAAVIADTVAVGATIADIAWTPSATNSLGYEINWRTGTNPWNGPGRLANTASTYRILGLLPGTLYTFRFRNICSSGVNPWETKTFTTDAMTSCNMPTPSVTNLGASIADISWTVAGGTSGITAYEINWQPVGGAWNGSGRLNTPSLAAYRMLNLTPGTNYNYRMRSLCTNLNEWTGWATGTFNTNAAFTCNAPTLAIDSTGGAVADVSWTPTANTAAYEINWQPVGGVWNGSGRLSNPALAAYRIPNLTPGTTYNYRFRSLCTPINEWSPWSTGMFATDAATGCSSPTPISVTQAVSYTDLSWTPTANTAAYEINWQPVGGVWNGTGRLNNPALAAYRIPNLVANTTYNYRMRSLCVAMNEWAAWTTGTFSTLGAGRVGMANVINVNLYPNPSTGVVNIQLEGASEATYEVFSLMGQRVAAGSIANEVATLSLDAQPSGMYLLRVVSGGVVTTKQLVINK